MIVVKLRRKFVFYIARADDEALGNRRDLQKTQNYQKKKGTTMRQRDAACETPYRHHVEPRVQLCVPKEETFPIPLKYIDVTRTTHTNLLQESRIDNHWNVDVDRSLSDSWTGFHPVSTVFSLPERPKFRIMRENLCRKRTGDAVLRAENFGDMTTAEHNVLDEGCESRNNHRHAVVQDQATQRRESHQCKTKPAPETEKSSRKFLELSGKPKANNMEFGKSFEDLS